MCRKGVFASKKISENGLDFTKKSSVKRKKMPKGSPRETGLCVCAVIFCLLENGK